MAKAMILGERLPHREVWKREYGLVAWNCGLDGWYTSRERGRYNNA